MKKLRIVTLFFIFSCLVVTSLVASKETPKQNVYAQSTVTPTLYCLAADCPGTTASSSPIPTLTGAIQPQVASPCANTALSQATSHPDQKKSHHHKEGGFLKDLFQLFLMLIELVLKASGGSGLPCSPSTTPSVTVEPTVAPTNTISTTPVVSGSPQTNGTKTPNQILQLNTWNLTIPVGNPTIIKNDQLLSGYQDQYFHADSTDTGVVFHAPVNGPTTANSNYPRSELRELNSDGSNASWESSTGTHTMTIDEAITAVPQTKQHIIAGQIHDTKSDVIVIRLEMPKLFVDIGGVHGPVLDENYTLGKRFTAKFEVTNGQTNIYYNNNATPAYTMSTSYSGAYFKAGAYTQSNCTKESQCDENNFGEVIIYKLDVTHQ